ncbi:MAG: phosphoethanolamine--lipid A transferase [Sulfurovum sp.]|nr:phosphoethanolamine--lipid A transferase [Sulfurovum sp.]
MLRSSITQTKLILYASLFFVLFDNYEFFHQVITIYQPTGTNIIYIISTAVVLFALLNLFFHIVSAKYVTKPLMIVLLLISSVTGYFMNTYHIVIDEEMIRNALQTNVSEASDLWSFWLFLYLFFLGIIPSVWVYRVKIHYHSWKTEIVSKLKMSILFLVLIVVTVTGFGKFYTSFFREHKILRFYTNPPFWMDCLRIYFTQTYFTQTPTLKLMGKDATIDDQNLSRKLVIVVVGEAARADHFSINGYQRPTTPLLENEHIINYPHMYSCATSTAQSVPCMFSYFTHSEYDYTKAYYTENILDILNHTKKVAILWRDNNSNSKGVALRVRYENFRIPKNNPKCDGECRDVGMLSGLQAYIEANKDKHILIVLHQMGNHGPAYYKRSPQRSKKFMPECMTNQLEQCERQGIINAYDNALHYTDIFLNQTIALAKKYPDKEVAVIYMSDHGESLGESGIYLHGLPYFIAPDAQKHIGAFIWLNHTLRKKLAHIKDPQQTRSHDYLFHTLLGLFDVRTSVYDVSLDLLHKGKEK